MRDPETRDMVLESGRYLKVNECMSIHRRIFTCTMDTINMAQVTTYYTVMFFYVCSAIPFKNYTWKYYVLHHPIVSTTKLTQVLLQL